MDDADGGRCCCVAVAAAATADAGGWALLPPFAIELDEATAAAAAAAGTSVCPAAEDAAPATLARCISIIRSLIIDCPPDLFASGLCSPGVFGVGVGVSL